MGMKVSDVMTRAIVFGRPEDSVMVLAAMMREKNISSVVISNGASIVGIVTEHDLASKVVAGKKDPSATRAAEIMSQPVATVASEADLEEAARIMRDRRIKKLVAVGNGKAEGIVTSFDILVAEPIIRLIAERGL